MHPEISVCQWKKKKSQADKDLLVNRFDMRQKQSWSFNLTSSNKRNFSRMKTNVYGSKGAGCYCSSTLLWKQVLFSDEIISSMEHLYNCQNNRIWSTTSQGKSFMVQHRQNPKFIMVWQAICGRKKNSHFYWFWSQNQ